MLARIVQQHDIMAQTKRDEDSNKRIVLEHTKGRMKGIHSICGLKSAAVQPLPEVLDIVEMIDSPAMREPGLGELASLVAEKRSYTLYRQIYKPTEMQGRAMPNAPFNERQT